MFSFIIVDYKSLYKTMEYITSCLKNIKSSAEIHYIVVDNDSETTLEEQEKHLSVVWDYVCECEGVPVYYGFWKEQKIYFVKAKSNGGYGRGNNLGAKVSRVLFNDRFLIFSNNDLNFTHKVIIEEAVLLFEKDKKIAALGPGIVDLNGNRQNPGKFQSMSKQLFGDYLELLLPKALKRQSMTYEQASGVCDWVSGAFMLVEAVKFWDAGGFDENTFLFMEETILSRRFEKINCYMYFDDSVQLIHNHGETVKSTIGVIRGIQHDFQSRIYYYRNYQNIKRIWIVLARIHFRVFLILFSLKKKVGSVMRKG